MRKAFILAFCTLILVLTNNCERAELQRIQRPPVYTGLFDTSFIYQDFKPAICIELHDTILDNYYYGSDSIDIDFDEEYDLILKFYLHSDKNSTDRDVPILNYSYYEIGLKNNFELAYQSERIYAGLGGYDGINWVDTINFYIKISNLPSWYDSIYPIFMWCDSMPTSSESYFTKGCWFNVSEEVKYIALRKKFTSHYKYGWIEVNAASHDSLLFLSCAFEK